MSTKIPESLLRSLFPNEPVNEQSSEPTPPSTSLLNNLREKILSRQQPETPPIKIKNKKPKSIEKRILKKLDIIINNTNTILDILKGGNSNNDIRPKQQ